MEVTDHLLLDTNKQIMFALGNTYSNIFCLIKIISLISLLFVSIGFEHVEDRVNVEQSPEFQSDKKIHLGTFNPENSIRNNQQLTNPNSIHNPVCGAGTPKTDITGKYILLDGFSVFEDNPDHDKTFYKSVLKIEKLKKGEFIYSQVKKVKRFTPVHEVSFIKCLGNKWVMMDMSYNKQMKHYELDISNYGIYKFMDDHLFHIRFTSNNTSYFIFEKMNPQKQLHLSLRKTFKEASQELEEKNEIYFEARSIEQEETNNIDVYYDCKDGEYMTTYDYEDADYVTRTVKRSSRYKRYDSLFIAKSKKYAPHPDPDWLNTVDSCL